MVKGLGSQLLARLRVSTRQVSRENQIPGKAPEGSTMLSTEIEA